MAIRWLGCSSLLIFVLAARMPAAVDLVTLPTREGTQLTKRQLGPREGSMGQFRRPRDDDQPLGPDPGDLLSLSAALQDPSIARARRREVNLECGGLPPLFKTRRERDSAAGRIEKRRQATALQMFPRAR